MDLTVTKKLEIINKEEDFLELEVGDCATIWLKNGDCMTAEIVEIRDNELLIEDEDGEKVVIPFENIEDIEEG